MTGSPRNLAQVQQLIQYYFDHWLFAYLIVHERHNNYGKSGHRANSACSGSMPSASLGILWNSRGDINHDHKDLGSHQRKHIGCSFRVYQIMHRTFMVPAGMMDLVVHVVARSTQHEHRKPLRLLTPFFAVD
jgi:hypothetical protein